MNINILTPELLDKRDAYWRAANCLSVSRIYPAANPLLKRKGFYSMPSDDSVSRASGGKGSAS